jgi:hypothetical protein
MRCRRGQSMLLPILSNLLEHVHNPVAQRARLCRRRCAACSLCYQTPSLKPKDGRYLAMLEKSRSMDIREEHRSTPARMAATNPCCSQVVPAWEIGHGAWYHLMHCRRRSAFRSDGLTCAGFEGISVTRKERKKGEYAET